jgi:arsenate reductase
MTIKMWGYNKCSTCRAAQKWLQQQGLAHQSIDIISVPPTLPELRALVAQSGLPIQSFFNTSGELYRELRLKERLKEMDEEQKLALLAQHGKLIKRPLVADGSRVTVGYKEHQYEQMWGERTNGNET